MPKETEGVGIRRTVKTYPEGRSNEARVDDFKQYMKLGQKLELDNIGKWLVVQEVYDNRPKQIIVLSDWHLGSIYSNLDEMEKLRDYVLGNPDVLIIFAGDEIEGHSGGKYSSTIEKGAKVDVQQQMEFFRIMFLEPLAEENRILGMVSEYWAHPGWIFDATTLNTWRAMIGELDIKLIQNGGDIVVKFPNGYEQTTKVWHNPPGAGEDELAGQRRVMQKTSESARPAGSVAAHIHREAVAEEVYAGAKFKVFYIAAGTTKGSTPGMAPDPFGVRLGLAGAEPQGQGVTIVPKRGRREAMNIPFANLKQGQMAIDAVTLLDRVESAGTRKELLELIHQPRNKHGVEVGPKISYSESSRLGHRYRDDRPLDKLTVGGETIKNPYSKMEMKAPYSKLNYEIETELPIALHLIANARLGSSSEGYKGLQGYVKNIVENPHALMVFLRNMIDKEAGRLPNRVEVLDKLVGIIGEKGERSNYQTLAIMMCESMRQSAWKGKVGKEAEHFPLAPASYVATETKIPLVHHLSILKLAIGPRGPKTIYSGAMADKLNGHGSGSRPEWGPSQLYSLHIQEKPGWVAGGHMKDAGAMTIYDPSNAETRNPIFVGTGWWSKAVDSGGLGNVQEGAEPGQAVIFMPGKGPLDYSAFPTVSAEETEYMHDALMLLKGLEILGIKDRVMKRGR